MLTKSRFARCKAGRMWWLAAVLGGVCFGGALPAQNLSAQNAPPVTVPDNPPTEPWYRFNIKKLPETLPFKVNLTSEQEGEFTLITVSWKGGPYPAILVVDVAHDRDRLWSHPVSEYVPARGRRLGRRITCDEKAILKVSNELYRDFRVDFPEQPMVVFAYVVARTEHWLRHPAGEGPMSHEGLGPIKEQQELGPGDYEEEFRIASQHGERSVRWFPGVKVRSVNVPPGGNFDDVFEETAVRGIARHEYYVRPAPSTSEVPEK